MVTWLFTLLAKLGEGKKKKRDRERYIALDYNMGSFRGI